MATIQIVQRAGLFGLSCDFFQTLNGISRDDPFPDLLGAPCPGSFLDFVDLSVTAGNETPTTPASAPNASIDPSIPSFVFPEGIWLIDKEGYEGLQGRGTMHTFTITSADGSLSYGHVITRYYSLKDNKTAQATLRGSVAMKAMAKAAEASSKAAAHSVTPSGVSPIKVSLSDPLLDSTALYVNVTDAYEPLAICIFTSEPCIEAMRAFLHSFDLAIPAHQRFSISHIRILLTGLAGLEAIQHVPMLCEPGAPFFALLRDDVVKVFGAENAWIFEEFEKASGIMDCLTAPSSGRDSARSAATIAAENELQCIPIPWARLNANTSAPAAFPAVVLSPPSALTFELPQTAWKCSKCFETRNSKAYTRHSLRQIALSELRQAGYTSMLPSELSEESLVFEGPLSNIVRCVEQRWCVPCVLRVPCERDAACSLLHDELWPYLQDAVLPELRQCKDLPANVIAPLDLRTVPCIFTVPSATGLVPLDVDVSQLFRRVSPAHIITLLTTLLYERPVLLTCRDSSVLMDIAHSVLALLAPFMYVGVYYPRMHCSLPYDLLQAQFFLAGAHPAVCVALQYMVEGRQVTWPQGIDDASTAHLGIVRPFPASDCSNCGLRKLSEGARSIAAKPTKMAEYFLDANEHVPQSSQPVNGIALGSRYDGVNEALLRSTRDRETQMTAVTVGVLDIDADTLSAGFLPDQCRLPPRIAQRLWRAIILYANHFAASHASDKPPPLYPNTPGHEPAAAGAMDLCTRMAKAAARRGWNAKLAAESEMREGVAVVDLHTDSLFAPFSGDSCIVNAAASPPSSASDSKLSSSLSASFSPGFFGRGKLASRSSEFEVGSPASIPTQDVINSDVEEEEGDDEDDPLCWNRWEGSSVGVRASDASPFDVLRSTLDCQPIVVESPWTVWRAAVNAGEQCQTVLRRVVPKSGAAATATSSSMDVLLRIRQPSLHLTKLRMEFLKTMALLVKSFRVHFTEDSRSRAVTIVSPTVVRDTATTNRPPSHSIPVSTNRGRRGSSLSSMESLDVAIATPATSPAVTSSTAVAADVPAAQRRTQRYSFAHPARAAPLASHAVPSSLSRFHTLIPRSLASRTGNDGAEIRERFTGSVGTRPRRQPAPAATAVPFVPALELMDPQEPMPSEQPYGIAEEEGEDSDPAEGSVARPSIRVPQTNTTVAAAAVVEGPSHRASIDTADLFSPRTSLARPMFERVRPQAANSFLAESPPDLEVFLTQLVVNTMHFPQFLIKRISTFERDLFDHYCYRQMFTRAYRRDRLKSQQRYGKMHVSVAGKKPVLRLVALREEGGKHGLTFYSSPDELIRLDERVRRLEASVQFSSSADAAAAATTLQELQRLREKKAALAESARDSEGFLLVPSRTDVVIPVDTSKYAPTPFVFQLVNPSVEEMMRASEARGVDASTSVISGGIDRKVVTFWAPDSASRRDWIAHIKACLRTVLYKEHLKTLYLEPEIVHTADVAE